ncbi:hypothetical protein Lal_00023938 [Lupinus albus]|nr:hypothetical protein Lal_00023938 [Lupinus albus]
MEINNNGTHLIYSELAVRVDSAGDGGIDGAGGHANLVATKGGNIELKPLSVITSLCLNWVGEGVKVRY